jgi:hypothetical protein
VNFPTRGQNVLDLVFTSCLEPDTVLAYPVDPAVKSDHVAINCELSLPIAVSVRKARQQPRRITNWKKMDKVAFRNVLLLCPWDLLDRMSVNSACNLFYEFLDAIIKDCVPETIIKESKYPRWFDAELISLLKVKERARRIFKKSKLIDDGQQFATARTTFKKALRRKDRAYLYTIAASLKEDLKNFFKYVKNCRKNNSSNNEFSYNNVTSTTMQEACNMFCEYFTNVFAPKDKKYLYDSTHHYTNYRYFQITKEQIIQEIKNLKCGKSTGSDHIPIAIIKEYVNELAAPLYILFNKVI